MTPTLDDPLQSPQESDTESVISSRNPAARPVNSPLAAVARLPYRRSNASLSNLFASTSSLPASPALGSFDSGTSTPTTSVPNGSMFSPGGSAIIRSDSPALINPAQRGEIRDLIIRALAPHVSVLASDDTEELVRHKGIHGGLLELLRPFGEKVQGKVTIRDSSGASRSWDDFGIRFIGVQDGLQAPTSGNRASADSSIQDGRKRSSSLEYKPARMRTGGNVPQVEALIERHLTFAEEQSGPVEADYLNRGADPTSDPGAPNPFYLHYIRRLLSGLPLVAAESFSHPVALVIAISSRSASPIEELRNLYSSSNGGDHGLPHWVHNEFLRYYVLIHDEDYDDITKSMALFDQMKRHFGLHCHLLRLRSTLCTETDDGSIKLPPCEWQSAAEELAEITRRESSEDDEDPTPWILETDAAAIRVFVREMVTQSIVPSMERASATWNDQVASRRRGLSGRFMSLSKRFTGFGSRNSTIPIAGGNSNYDSVQGFYRPDAPEALMRKLADYAMMLRDYRLAQSTYDILCQDFKGDKAWRYYAAANEMMAISLLLTATALNTKARADIDQYIENAYYSYATRASAPYNALRTLLTCAELLKLRTDTALDDSARWSSKILDDRLVGPIGHVLVTERIASCYSDRKGFGNSKLGTRKRKAAFWNLVAADAWLRLDKASRAQLRLREATRLYMGSDEKLQFDEMASFLKRLQHAVHVNHSGPQHLDGADLLAAKLEVAEQEQLQQEQEQPDTLQHDHVEPNDVVELLQNPAQFNNPVNELVRNDTRHKRLHSVAPSTVISSVDHVHQRAPSLNLAPSTNPTRDDGFE